MSTDEGPDISLMALFDCLQCASLATLALAGSEQDRGRAQAPLLEASVASMDAFPAGSKQADALGVVLGAITDLTREVAV